MARFRMLTYVAAALGLTAAVWSPALAKPQGPSVLVVGVDHVDLANQRPDQHRVFEYTDFFARSVTVHRHEVIDFRVAPGAFHVVGVAKEQEVARKVYPIATLDTNDANAIGSGDPKIKLGPSNFFIIGGSTHGGGNIGTDPSGNTPPPCGLTAMGEKPCEFKGGDDIEVAGPLAGFAPPSDNGPPAPAPVDWSIEIDAAPGSYDFLCFIHPGMQGSVNVVDSDDRVTTQAENDARGAAQFAHDQAEALAAEAAANTVRFSGDAPGRRTYDVDVSTGVPDLHAVVLEMLPQHLDLKDGDRVQYHWAAPNEVHTVGFPADDPRLPPPFGFDCGGTGFQAPGAGPPCLEPGHTTPELVGDPGNAPSGTLLTSPTALVDSGLLAGRGYDLEPTRQTWSVRTNRATANGTYEYQCTVHDFMHGTLSISH